MFRACSSASRRSLPSLVAKLQQRSARITIDSSGVHTPGHNRPITGHQPRRVENRPSVLPSSKSVLIYDYTRFAFERVPLVPSNIIAVRFSPAVCARRSFSSRRNGKCIQVSDAELLTLYDKHLIGLASLTTLTMMHRGLIGLQYHEQENDTIRTGADYC